jgi:hypothetical protein
LQKAVARIVLSPDGRFVASELPGLLYLPPGRIPLNSGTGTWRLVLRENRQEVQLDFEAPAADKQSGRATTAFVDVSRGWSKADLSYFIGDPDQGHKIDFEKIDHQSN